MAAQPHPTAPAPSERGSPKTNRPAEALSSRLDPTQPWSRGSERPLPEPHRTLQLPKPKRGALLSAGIWVVVKRLHRLVHELQGWLRSFHGGGSGGNDSEKSDSSPKVSACSAFKGPHCLGHSRSLTGAISSFLAVTREGGGSSWKLPPRKQRIDRFQVPGSFLSCLPARIPGSRVRTPVLASTPPALLSEAYLRMTQTTQRT